MLSEKWVARAALIEYKSGPVIMGAAVRGLEAGGCAPSFLYHLHGLLSSHLFWNNTVNRDSACRLRREGVSSRLRRAWIPSIDIIAFSLKVSC